MMTRKFACASMAVVSIFLLGYLQKLRETKRRKRKLVEQKKFRRKRGQKAREEALKHPDEHENTENDARVKNPAKKRRLNDVSDDETSSSSSSDSETSESDDSSLFSMSSETESNSESDISSLPLTDDSNDTFGNNDDLSDNENHQNYDDEDDEDDDDDDDDEVEDNTLLFRKQDNDLMNAISIVKLEPYDDPLATASTAEKPNEDIKPNIDELEEALENAQKLTEESLLMATLLEVVQVKEEPSPNEDD